MLTRHPRKNKFKGFISWHAIAVQRDLEARKIINLIHQKPKLISLKK